MVTSSEVSMEAVLVAGPGSGMVTVTGRWNFLLRGSTVTMGDTATLLRSTLAVSSGGIGCACKRTKSGRT